MERIILGSGSPRRHEILELACVKHEIIVPKADESAVPYTGDCARYVGSLAKLKSDALSEILEKRDENQFDVITICADTVVFSPKCPQPLGKPKDKADAVRMLTMLSGTKHYVMTGVCLKNCVKINEKFTTERQVSFAETTEVGFRDVTADEIEAYVDREPPLDKAGAYGIQDSACSFVSGITGDFYNVVGLPICRIMEEIKKMSAK